MPLADERERELLRRVAPVVLPRFDELVTEWEDAWRSGQGGANDAPPDVASMTRTALEDGMEAGLAHQHRLARRLVAGRVPLDTVVSAVLAWEQTLLRRLAREAVEDVFTSAAALNRFVHGLVVRVAEGYWETVRDETERVRRGLEEADRLKTELVSMVSHDLKTPLTTIQGCVVSLEDMPDLSDAERSRFVRMIGQNAERLSRLISQILDVSSIEARAMDMQIVELDLASTVTRLVAGMLPGANVKVDVPGDLPPVLADRDAVERILVNLIDNAVRLSPAGEPVLVQARTASHGVELRVVDRGPGVPPDRREGLFTKFFQVDPSPGGRRSGSGLGLAIVRGLAEAMGGRVAYAPNEPSGAVFSVVLPAVADADGPP